MNLHICDWTEVDGDIRQIMWRLQDLDGECRVYEGRVETPFLSDNDYVELRPSTIREIRTECQEWLDEKPERDAKYAKEEAEYDRVRAAWESWDEFANIHHAIPSVPHTPGERVHDGLWALVAFDEDRKCVTCELMEATADWGDVLLIFDKTIKRTGDTHHCFLEGVGQISRFEKPRLPDFLKESYEFPILTFHTGS